MSQLWDMGKEQTYHSRRNSIMPTLRRHRAMSVPKTIGDVIYILENSTHQGRALDEPEGSCYKSFSCTLCRLMVDALKSEQEELEMYQSEHSLK